jgi:hypothetical protein
MPPGMVIRQSPGGRVGLNTCNENHLTDLPPHIFPTRHREKHSHLVSYPLGAEALSRALDGVPQHGDFTCSFYAGNTHQRLDEPKQLALSVMYRRRERSFYDGPNAEARGVLSPFWAITVFAVPRTLRHPIKTALINEALPNIVRPWLIKNANITGKVGSSGFNLDYDVASATLMSSERSGLLPDRV